MTELDRDPTMKRVERAFTKSKLSYRELGEAMGYGDNAKQSAHQFVTKTNDPKLSMLRKFAKAVGVPLITMYYWRQGRDKPNGTQRQRIERFSKGRVPAASWA